MLLKPAAKFNCGLKWQRWDVSVYMSSHSLLRGTQVAHLEDLRLL